MTNMYTKLLEMIKVGSTVDEVCKELKLNKMQLLRKLEYLKRVGYNVKNTYGVDGEISLYINFDIHSLVKPNTFEIDGLNKDDEMKMLVISDTHVGNARANTNYIDFMYNVYALDNDIHLILHCGDVLDGGASNDNKMSPTEQIDYLIHDYPQVDGITTFLQEGNHETWFLENLGLNIDNILKNYRSDIVSLGFGVSKFKVFDNNFFVSHEHKFCEANGLRIMGHSHRYRMNINNQCPLIVAPTLSDFLHTTDFPAALELTFKIKNKVFDTINVKHLIIDDELKVRESSNIAFDCPKKHELSKK